MALIAVGEHAYPEDAAVRSKIQGAYSAMNAALAAKHKDHYFSFFHPAFGHIGLHGDRETLSKRRSQWAGLMGVVRRLTAKTTIVAVTVTGAQAVARVRTHTVITFFHRDMGRVITKTADEIAVDTWQRSSKRWLMKSSKTVALTRS